ncbi:MAG: polysaccharide biosynthesis protein [Acidobacteria bacterium]|nr:polysaccharide biosynthesis protein [Acidobacteriota bacterium]MBV9071307.1 polysaccharide biosynthesis protein [Acidobacteriota bacterium]MBV9188145.1 polysaccharide biosynthesis protein [Acidobacteriota bacterium]
MILDGKRVLVTGGTGSLGGKVVRALLRGDVGRPAGITVFSRDEAKQNDMRLSFLNRPAATDEVIYTNSQQLLSFRIGDVRDYAAIRAAIEHTDVVINAAALKQVPSCEYFPVEAVQTNVMGAANLVRAIRESGARVETVVGISTDKACKPVNVMGMTKALMERIFAEANLEVPSTRFVCVRYGNVIASRGSVVPLFVEQIANGGPVTITTEDMTRFLLSLDRAVETVFAALEGARQGETYVPRVAAARIVDVASTLIDGRAIRIDVTGVRPGEKTHEIMVSEEECHRTISRGDYYVILPMLPELRDKQPFTPSLTTEYSSSAVNLEGDALREALAPFMAATR